MAEFTHAERGNSPAQRDIANVLHPYTNLDGHRRTGPLMIEGGKGIHVFDDQGKEYIEGLAGLWCAALGFNENALIEAAVEQMRLLPTYHVFGGKSHNALVDLAERLKGVAPAPFDDGARVFFANSGSEANDTIMKIVWYYNNAIGRPEKKKFISRVRGYHGVTIASASLTGLPAVHRDFDLPLPQVKHTSCPHYYRFGMEGETEEDFATRMAADLEAMILEEGPDTVAAFIAEPVMGAGGVIVPPKTYFPKIQAVLRKYDIFMVADEVICGFCRTGNYWGSQTFDIQPDFLSCAKQLSSAYMPISAIMVPGKVHDVMIDQSKKIGAFAHGVTYGGHPVPAAVACKTMEIYEERDILGHVRRVATKFQERLHRLGEHPLVGETRGVGLIGSMELAADKASKTPFEPEQGVGAHALLRAQEHGVISRVIAGDMIPLCPPLIIQEHEIDELFDRVERALDDTEHWVSREGLRPAA